MKQKTGISKAVAIILSVMIGSFSFMNLSAFAATSSTITRAEFMKLAAQELARTNGEIITASNYKGCFNDVNGWAEKYICYLNKKGIVKGFQDGTVKPNNSITRAESIKVISVIYAIPQSSNDKAAYIDVDQNAWYYSYVQSAASAGITDVTPWTGKAFRPGVALSPAAAITMINNADGAFSK